MALDLAALKEQCNVTGAADDALLGRLLTAATRQVERQLGYKLDDATALPDGAPADLELAVYQLAADWYENREANLVGVTAQPLPFGVRDIIAEYRNYTFGLGDDG